MSKPDVGSQEALCRALVDGSSHIKRYLSRHSSDATEVADYYQEAVVRVLEKAREQSIRNPVAYALTIAKNLMTAPSRTTPLTDEMDPECPGPTPEQQAESDERFRQFQAILQRMPPLRRRVLIRRRLHGESREAIARSLGLSEEAVKKHITRAMIDLQQAIDRNDTA
ncbi:RNA polymerase sigma factor [Marinimicrobium agarilyticum]|uniref:RNA polymerase sigma factor n=1 Tax=Marinimicrobium agarilyticum TaxID=306546 RepID=UPI00042A234B|nr:sigma-70 family RNA polymerase sigma factor [Marinimicrobium agarilyticum]